jgi:hypothetical protein
MTIATPPRAPRPTRWQLGGQVLAVVADLPLFLTAPLFRRWHLRWGATPDEVEAALPGDELLPSPQFRCTRAITIQAPPSLVWPWLVQVGCLRAGFYSNDLLDNLGHPSARDIVPELQHLEFGQWIPTSPTAPSDVTAFRVEGFELKQWLLWRKPDSTWVWEAGRRRRRDDPSRHPRTCRLHLEPPPHNTAWGRADGVRRLRDDAQNAAWHQGKGRGLGRGCEPSAIADKGLHANLQDSIPPKA